MLAGATVANAGPVPKTHSMPWRRPPGATTPTAPPPSARSSRKSRNVARTGKAMAVVDTREPPCHAVMVKGDAETGPALSREEEYDIALRSQSGQRASMSGVAGEVEAVPNARGLHGEYTGRHGPGDGFRGTTGVGHTGAQGAMTAGPRHA